MPAIITALKGILLAAAAIAIIVFTMLYVRAQADNESPIWLNHDGLTGS